MATGTGAQPNRGLVISDITPSIAVPNTADDWNRIANTFERFQQAVIEPQLVRRAQRLGQEEGAAIARGEQEYKPLLGWGNVAEARLAARETAYQAQIRTDIDAREAAIRRDNALEPEAYQEATEKMIAGFVTGAPPEFAVSVETYARDRAQRGLEAVASSRTVADRKEAEQGLTVRIDQLTETMVALASEPGGRTSKAYLDAEQERFELQQMRVDNPWFNYSNEMRLADDEAVDDQVLAADVTRLGIGAYAEGGRGQPGYAAAMRFLDEEILNGEAFRDLPVARRQKLYRDARKAVADFTAADRESAKAEEEAERERRREQREIVGELRLGITIGEVSEDDILKDERIDEGQKAGLLAAVRAQRQRERREERAVTAAETEARAAQYAQFRDQADAGTLSASDLADASYAGLLTPGQIRTLQARRDRALKPIIDDVMDPFEDAARAPGRRNTPQMAVRRSRAEEAAAAFARANPNATLEERHKAGELIAQQQFGATRAGRPTTAQAAAQQRAQRIREVSAKIEARRRAGRPYSAQEQARMRREALDAD